MEAKSFATAHRAFTLIELIVVIGIIGILASVLMLTFSSGTEAARAAKCLANMRNLAQGAIGYAAQHYHYPYAGSHAAIGVDGGTTIYTEHVGWISWLSTDDYYHTRKRSSTQVTRMSGFDNISACCNDLDKAMFAITNGALWKCVGENLETYVCPSHSILARRINPDLQVRFSYAMSAYFGYDYSQGSEAVTSSGHHFATLNTSKLDRRLLFAELPFAIAGACDSDNNVDESTAYSTANNNAQTDCVLQYSGSAGTDGAVYNQDWTGKPEAIAFNHKTGKKYCAHVAFADGHVEKLVMPTDGELTSTKLTVHLCEGFDVAYDGSGYKFVTDGDK